MANGPQRESADSVSLRLVPCNEPEKPIRSIDTIRCKLQPLANNIHPHLIRRGG